MSFAHPWMLLGMLAALIPLLVHLFDRRRPRPHPFAAIAFVLRSQRRTASRLKLKRLLIYAMRTLILLAIPFALAKPEWRRSSDLPAAARGPAATAIVLDASLSMHWSDGSSSFERGRDEAREALRGLGADEPATFVLCAPGAAPAAAPTFDRGALRGQIDDAQVSFGPSDLNRCMDVAARALEESPLPGKRLVVISDFAAGALRLDAPPPVSTLPDGAPVRPEVVLRDVGREQMPNRAVVDLKVEPAVQVGPRAFAFTFTVRNHAAEAVEDLEASVRVGDQVRVKGFLDVPANGTAQKTLTHRFEEGGVLGGEVVIASDALAADDRRGFVVHVPRELRVLVVNGAPHASRYRDEAFFVEAALTAPGSPVSAAVRDVDAALREDLAAYHAVLLLNVPAPDAEAAARLAQFVERGGGLFISVGDQVVVADYNMRLGTLLPRALRDVRTSVAREEPDAETRAARLNELRSEHPVFAPFVGQAREGLMSARFYRYMLLEPGAATGTEVLATYEDGAPALAVARRGKGRVMLLTTTVDRDWSDLSIRTGFLPFLHRSCAYLAGALEERQELKARVGEALALPLEEVKATRVVAPSGAEVPARAQQDGALLAGPLLEPGVHQVLAADGKPLPSLTFAAQLDPSESDLTRHGEEQLEAYFGEGVVRGSEAAGRDTAIPLWTWVIVAAALAFFLEGLLLRT